MNAQENPIQFGVVREDPQIEINIVKRYGFDSAILIGSAGCTALSLKSFKPELELTLIEPNLAQIDLIKRKIDLLLHGDKPAILATFGVGKESGNNLIECGNFEKLFRQFRMFLDEFVFEAEERRRLLEINNAALWKNVFERPYWRTSFDLFFSDSLLSTMFGENAVRYAPKGSYPRYFQNATERGLIRSDAKENYFLHHIFLGYYIDNPRSLPLYLREVSTDLNLKFAHLPAEEFDGYNGRQLVHFSNIFDWCPPEISETIIRKVRTGMAIGSIVVVRQLNNNRDYRPMFGDGFVWADTEVELEEDRSLFYSKLEIGEKVA